MRDQSWNIGTPGAPETHALPPKESRFDCGKEGRPLGSNLGTRIWWYMLLSVIHSSTSVNLGLANSPSMGIDSYYHVLVLNMHWSQRHQHILERFDFDHFRLGALEGVWFPVYIWSKHRPATTFAHSGVSTRGYHDRFSEWEWLRIIIMVYGLDNPHLSCLDTHAGGEDHDDIPKTDWFWKSFKHCEISVSKYLLAWCNIQRWRWEKRARGRKMMRESQVNKWSVCCFVLNRKWRLERSSWDGRSERECSKVRIAYSGQSWVHQ